MKFNNLERLALEPSSWAINWDSPQSVGLRNWFPLGSYWDVINYVNGGPATVSGTPTWSSGVMGDCIDLNGTTDYLTSTDYITAFPCTLCAWFNIDNVTGQDYLVSVHDVGGSRYWALTVQGNIGGDPLRAQEKGSSYQAADSATAVTANTWIHGCAVFRSATDREIYFNGVSDGTNDTDSAMNPAPHDEFAIGVGNDGGYTSYFGGLVRDVRLYSVTPSPDVIFQMWEPQTRNDLVYPLGQKSYFFQGEAPAAFTGAPDPCVVPISYEL